MEDLVDRAFDRAQLLLAEHESDLSALPIAHQVVIRLVSAQGALDSGGYRYFFETNWPGQPPYEDFAHSYEIIGCHHAAAELRRVVSTFPFPDPHLNCDERVAFITAHYDENTLEVPEWGDELCGDSSVWQKLTSFCLRHRQELGV